MTKIRHIVVIFGPDETHSRFSRIVVQSSMNLVHEVFELEFVALYF